MFFTLFLPFSLAFKQICICNDICPSICPKDSYVTSQNLKLKDYLNTQIKDEKEIEVDLYSKHEGFVLSIEETYFNDAKTTIKVLSDSQAINIKIKKRFKLFCKSIEMKPNYKIILPDLIPIRSGFSSSKLNILDMPTTTPVPISVSLFTMERDGTSNCNTAPQTQKKNNHMRLLIILLVK